MKKTIFLLALIVGLNQTGKSQTLVDSSLIGRDVQIFTRLEQPAQYQGSDSAWQSFLLSHLSKNVPINNGAPEGTYPVSIRFIVSKLGNISDIEPETHFGYGMEDELIRVLKKSGKWVAGKQNNHIVNSFARVQFTFIVGDN